MGNPYIIVSNVTVPFGKTLTIEPGVHIKLRGEFPLYAFGSIIIGKEEGEEVVMTSIQDDSVDGDTNGDGNASVPGTFDWCDIGVHTNGVMNITNASIRYGGCSNYGQVHNFGGTLTISHSKILDGSLYAVVAGNGKTSVNETEVTRSSYGINYHGGTIVLKNNSIHDNKEYGVINTSTLHKVIDATGTWWGSAKGPFHPTLNPGGLGNNAVSDYILFDPWLQKDPFVQVALCTENCFSNVLFLPGIKTSRLYKQSANGEDELWIPNFYGDDVEELYLDENGKSINKVYAKEGDILEETPVGGNLYKTFLANLASLKASKIINDYSAFAYDWRQSVEDVAKNGTPYQGEIRSAIATLEGLSNTSKSNKVTIIAHSNGGLLAKAIMMELEKRGEGDKVDRIVFVGSPQMGTPMSILSTLYGYDESLVFDKLVSQSDARGLIENMPGAYGLLPSAEYFKRIENPFITFDSENTRYKSYKDVYGAKLQSFDEFKRFLLGKEDGRERPSSSEVERENILNDQILQEASDLHARLDAWAPPSNVEVTEIAGWGLDTISGVKYTEKEKTKCSGYLKTLSCKGTGEYEPVYDPVFTVDGDKVVVTPSALMLPESSNVKRYWVNLHDYNDETIFDSEHKNILETSSIQEILGKIILRNDINLALPNFISTSRPESLGKANSRLRMSLYSPLDIHLYDSHGNHTGPKVVNVDGQETTIFEEGIPNSYYFQFGDRKYVGFDESEPIHIEMDGYSDGSYTLRFDEVKVTETGDDIVSHTSFENLPTTEDTVVELDVPEEGLTGLSDLEADVDGNGIVDYEVVPVENGTATWSPDITAPVSSASTSGNEGKNGWYVGDVIVSLDAIDEEKGSGVDKTKYSLDGGLTWKGYNEPFTLSKEGIQNILFFSIDKAGNSEEPKNIIIKIDKTVPVLSISFDTDTKKISILGTDILSPVVVSSDTKGATVTDEAGHSVAVTFSKYNVAGKETKLEINSLSVDTVISPITSVTLGFEWSLEKNGVLKTFNETAAIESVAVHGHYLDKDNKTKIEKTENDIGSTETISGLVTLKLLIEDGMFKINTK